MRSLCPCCLQPLERDGWCPAGCGRPPLQRVPCVLHAPPCPGGGGHGAHLALNGECPWCGEVDASRIEDGSIEEIERRWGT